jgi:acetyl-CoA acyltransferase
MSNGGAIALGHRGLPGARILTTLLHEMRRRAPEEKRPFYAWRLCVWAWGRVRRRL